MAFLVGILRQHPELGDPAFVIQVDRTDLDDQLYDQFVVAAHLVGDVQHAGSVDELRGLLRTEGGEVIFTTIEKFRAEARTRRQARRRWRTRSSRRARTSSSSPTRRTARSTGSSRVRPLPRRGAAQRQRLGFTGTPSFGGVKGSLERPTR